jgi:hypothetical protein
MELLTPTRPYPYMVGRSVLVAQDRNAEPRQRPMGPPRATSRTWHRRITDRPSSGPSCQRATSVRRRTASHQCRTPQSQGSGSTRTPSSANSVLAYGWVIGADSNPVPWLRRVGASEHPRLAGEELLVRTGSVPQRSSMGVSGHQRSPTVPQNRRSRALQLKQLG